MKTGSQTERQKSETSEYKTVVVLLLQDGDITQGGDNRITNIASTFLKESEGHVEKGYISNLKVNAIQRENKKAQCVNLLKGRWRLDMIMISIIEGAKLLGMQGAF